jgi:site-specific DNA-methyltransferase (adenine-specific)
MDTAPFTLEIMQDAPAALHAPTCSPLLDLRLADCMDVMREAPDNHWDLAIVDPPYGIRVGDNRQGMGRRKGHKKASYDMGNWDHEAPPQEYFEELRRVSRNQIVWGANHFIERIPLNSPCWIVWDKMFSNKVSFAAVELAWTSFKTTAKKLQCHPLQDNRIHPTQKPVKLYDWLLANYAEKGDRILDTHLGSGSIAIAAHYAGVHLTACEIDAGYYAKAVERIDRETAQRDFFSENTSTIAPEAKELQPSRRDTFDPITP